MCPSWSEAGRERLPFKTSFFQGVYRAGTNFFQRTLRARPEASARLRKQMPFHAKKETFQAETVQEPRFSGTFIWPRMRRRRSQPLGTEFLRRLSFSVRMVSVMIFSS